MRICSLCNIVKKRNTTIYTQDIPGDPRKCDELVFFNNFKSSKARTKLLDGKEAEFYDNFSDINDVKII